LTSSRRHGGAAIQPQLDQVIRKQLDRLPRGLQPKLPHDERIVFIDNPRSGGGTYAQHAHYALQLYRFLGYNAELWRTERPHHATELAVRATEEGATLVIACSGDGGVRETVIGLMSVPAGKRPRFSVIPKGTANVLAKTLRLQIGPFPDFFQASLKQLYWSRTMPMDVGRVNDAPFTCFVGFGFDAAVVENVPSKEKKLFKEWAFVTAAFKTLVGWNPEEWTFQPYEAPEMRVRGIDEHGQTIDQKAWFVAVGNVQDYGTKWFPFMPGARIDDGLLDYIVVHTKDMMELLNIGRLVVTGKHLEHPAVRSFRSREPVTIESTAEAIPLHADSELLGRETRSTITLDPGALHVVY
jgi:YegS/Rv2252/BmrU family lipid kinase